MSRRHLAITCMLLLSAAGEAAAQSEGAADGRKRASAMRVTAGDIRVDGRLTEEIWLQATPVTDFTQKEPNEGAATTDEMDVRFVYDEGALYIGARMSTKNAPAIQAPLGRRDNADQAEHIQIWLDTFLDRRTATMFGVTAAGVRLDRYHSSDNEDSSDAGFDPVWAAQANVGESDWTAELWIPFSQLRFARETDQVWGLNIRRFRPTLDEEDYWVLVPRTDRVFVSRFGDLTGISGIRPTRRIEVLPYLAGASTVNANRDPGNPFDDGKNLESRVGADVKMGIGPNLTLEATVNPDFGQVEADPAEVNLTAFETRFSERRPFFTEGAQLFTLAHPNLYYSRRIGARPIGSAPGTFVDYPTNSTIVAASKLTGRLPSRMSVGFLSAVTANESARVSNADVPGTDDIRVAPRAYWNVGRLQQEFGRAGSHVGLLFNSVHREVSKGDPVADLYSRNAVAFAGDTFMRFKDGVYEWKFVGGGSFVNGEPKAIERWQRHSSAFAQRPDRDYARLDPTRTSITGWSMQTTFDRVSGQHWLWGTYFKMDSPFFQTNDIANLTGADGFMVQSNIRYRETRPGRVLRNYYVQINESHDMTYGSKDLQTGYARLTGNVTWSNFWTSSVSLTRNFRSQSVSLTRGGPLMQSPVGWTTTLNVGNRTTSQTRWTAALTSESDEDGGKTRRISGTLAVRPGPRWQLSMGPYYERLTETQQYVSTVTGGTAATYGSRYVFARIDRSTVSNQFRMAFTLRPDMNLDVYAEPFAASGRYYDFGELVRPKTRERSNYGATPGTSIVTGDDGNRTVTAGDQTFVLKTRDFNTLSFRSNVVLRWEWRVGSTLYLVWQQDRSETEVLGSHVNVGDMFRSLGAPGSNYFVVKMSFWLPIK
jgi:hypothetical protein